VGIDVESNVAEADKGHPFAYTGRTALSGTISYAAAAMEKDIIYRDRYLLNVTPKVHRLLPCHEMMSALSRFARKIMPVIFWVSPDIDRWRVQREGSFRAEGLFTDREGAVRAACRYARDHAPAQVKLQDNSGRIIEQLDFISAARAAA
jgi:hypothetical protein